VGLEEGEGGGEDVRSVQRRCGRRWKRGRRGRRWFSLTSNLLVIEKREGRAGLGSERKKGERQGRRRCERRWRRDRKDRPEGAARTDGGFRKHVSCLSLETGRRRGLEVGEGEGRALALRAALNWSRRSRLLLFPPSVRVHPPPLFPLNTG
jgi:hypothetical protein